MNKNLPMSFEEYVKRQHDTPFSFIFKKNNQFVYYFGCRHSKNPDDKQFEILKTFWADFLEKTERKNCMVFLESNKLPEIKGIDERNVIAVFGERGLATLLASKEHLPIIYPELPLDEEADYLAQKFPMDLIVYYYFIRSVNSQLPVINENNFNEMVSQSIKSVCSRLKLQNEICNLESVKQTHKDVFKDELSAKNQNISRASAPIYYDSIINDVVRASTIFRDNRVLETIEKFWNEGKNIFIVYGASHAVRQELAIRTL